MMSSSAQRRLLGVASHFATSQHSARQALTDARHRFLHERGVVGTIGSLSPVTGVSRGYTSAAMTKALETKTAAYVCIGDEILTGKVRDSNGYFLAKKLFEQGVVLRAMEVVPDEEDAIKDSLQRNRHHDFIFTTGGIGPTHDDITYQAVAATFDVSLEFHQPTVDKLTAWYEKTHPGTTVNEARLRMALFPAGSRIIECEGLWVPIVVTGNVYIFPGIPSLFERMFNSAAHLFEGPKRSRVAVWTRWPEGDYAKYLTTLHEQNPDMIFGSYPRPDRWSMITLESFDETKLREVAEELCKATEGELREWVELGEH